MDNQNKDVRISS